MTPEMFAQTANEIVSILMFLAATALATVFVHVVGSRRDKVRADRQKRIGQ